MTPHLIDSLAKNHWYSFYDNAFDKVVASYTALFVALVATAVALFLIKYWYDNKQFNSKLNNVQKSWENNRKQEKNQSDDKIHSLEKQIKQLNEIKSKFDVSNNKMTENIEELDARANLNYYVSAIETKVFVAQLEFYIEFNAWKNQAKNSTCCNEIIERLIKMIAKMKDEDVNILTITKNKSSDNEYQKRILYWLNDKKIVDVLFHEIQTMSKVERDSLTKNILLLKSSLERLCNMVEGSIEFECINSFFVNDPEQAVAT